jgi:protoheme IX farnesyltransferase
LFKTYYQLTKPGIIYGNILTAAAGFFLASRGHLEPLLLVATLMGIALVMASGCVFNNYIDRDIDALMERTKNRALVLGLVSPYHALWYGAVLGILGAIILFLFTNILAGMTALFGLFAYVVLYSLWTKRTSVYGTLVGSISGAVPPVVGYIAVSHVFDLGVFIIFTILVFWQMAHSYAIAIYRLNDYGNAHIPVLPVKKGIAVTKKDMAIYVVLTTLAMLSLAIFKYAGSVYFLSCRFRDFCGSRSRFTVFVLRPIKPGRAKCSSRQSPHSWFGAP